ncbi:MAG: undecaprenyl-diphosphate phosphatase [Bacteroidetes bacterium]|nr:undecaprenyl-diphosphate phosphatase [Bacteroidota bacterium]
MDLLEAILIAIVEGFTEFLPISSTGHMIIAEKLLTVPDNDFTKLFTVGIQLGAILAVVVLYWKKFFMPAASMQKRFGFYFKLGFAVLPALVIGFLLSDWIDSLLESTLTVAISLVAGGIVLLFIDNFFKTPLIHEEEQVSFKSAFLIGCWQCLAMVPGVSRSAASIIGGMQQKLNRKVAAEFSFFLAVPTMAAATGYKLLKTASSITSTHLQLFAIGNLVAFVVAIITIKFFIGFLQHNGFKFFAYYRIFMGVLLFILIYNGTLSC